MKVLTALFCVLLFASCHTDSATPKGDIIDSLNLSADDKKAIIAYFKYYDSISRDYNFSSEARKITMEIPMIDSIAMRKEDTSSKVGASSSFNENLQDKVNKAAGAATSYKQQHSSEAAELADIERNVKWIFSAGNSNPPTRVETYFVKVSYFGYTFIRGWVDANSCGTNAVFLTVCGRRDEAMSWLAAAQAHNPSIIQTFRRHYDYTLDYTVANFGVDVLGHYLGTYWPGVKDLVGYVNKRYANYTPDPNPPAFRPEGPRHRESRN